MKHIKYKIFYIVVLIGLGSCTDEFLENEPIGQPTEVSFYDSFDKLDLTATAAYGILCSRDIDLFYFIPFQVASDDIEVGGENLGDWPEWQNIDRLTHTPNESRVFEEPYVYWYKGIRLTNYFLNHVDKVVEEDITAKLDVVKQRTAEMRFLRAFYHFLLMQTYGGVPWVDYIVSPDEYAVPRDDIATVLHYIQSELEAIIPDLKEKSTLGASNIGRASKGAARALLAKAYLYESSYAENYAGDIRFGACENKYDKALTYAEELIESDQYELVGINGERFKSWAGQTNSDSAVGGFRWLFTLDGDNSSESVWEVQNVMDGRDWTLTRGSYYTIYTTARFYYINDSRTSQGTSQVGWSFNIPSKYLVAAFGNQDDRETNLSSSPMNPLLDPRFSYTIATGDSIIIKNSKYNNVYTKQWDRFQVNHGGDIDWYPVSFSNIPAGTIHRKYECSVQEYWSSNAESRDNNGPINMKYIRYADVVLFAAEAAYKTGAEDKALMYVNMVRKRARMSGDTGYPEDLTSVTFEDIMHERRLELACEPARFHDLVRWGKAYEFINGIHLASLGEGVPLTFIKEKHEFMPLSANQVLRNDGLEQYDAWK